MQTSADGNEDNPYLQESLQRFVKEQRLACEELNALIGEFQAVLQQFASRENLLTVFDQPVESTAPVEGSRQDSLSVYDLVLRNTRDAMTRTQALRAKSQRLREAVARKDTGAVPGGPSSPLRNGHNLSRRELEVLQLMVQGKSSKEIAAALSISFKTAVTHRSSIMSKMDVHEVASVVREAIRRGWV